MLKNKKPELLNINGHRVLYFKIPNKTIHVESVIKTGFVDEKQENSGINHLLEHVLTNAWGKCNNKSCSTYWANKGGIYNASTDEHKINYYISGTKNMQDDIINYIVDITLNPTILKSNIDNEKHAVKTELLGAINDNIHSLYDTYNKNMYKIEGLKYSGDMKLQIKNLSKINLKDLQSWYNKYYKKNILFIIIGDIEKDELPKYFKKTSKHLQTKRLKIKGGAKKTLKSKCFINSKRLVFSPLKEAQQVRLLIGFTSNLYQDNKELLYAEIACNALESVFYKKLREESKLIYSISINLTTTECGTTVEIFTEIDPDKAKKVYKIIFKLIDYYQKKYFENKLINGIKNKLTYKHNNSSMQNNNVIELYADQYFNQLNKTKPYIYTLADIKKSISLVDKEILQKIMKKIFNINNSLTTYQYSRKDVLM